jgi:hypothetical protein
VGTSKTNSTRKQPARRVDWSLAPRGVVSATAQVATGLVALGGAGDLAHINPVWAAAGTGVGALSNLVVTARHTKHTPGAICYRLACWVGAGGWLTWAWMGPHHWYNLNGLAALAIGATGFAMTAPFGREKRKSSPAAKAAAAPGGELVPVSSDPVGKEWQARFRRVCTVKVLVIAVNRWANGAGYDVHCLLPPGNITRDRIAAFADALATDARLPDGCGVEVRPVPGGKGSRGEFILGVNTVNRLGTADDPEPVKIPYPADYSPRSLLQLVALGEHRDGSVAGVMLRERALLLVGQTGGGKTNQLDGLTLGIGRCRDALNWHIDMNGGGMSQLWLRPWLNGETDRPAIDWVAPTPIEALFMTEIALAIAKDRKVSYREYKAAANSKLLPISPDLPQIEITIDEGAEVLSPTNRDPITSRVRDNLEELQRIGRNEAVRPAISALRPTQDHIAPNILKQSAIKMATYGTDNADLGHLYGWKRGISMDDLPAPGCAFLAPDTTATPRPMKAYYLEPDQIHQAALAISGYRPDLDDPSATIANSEYEFFIGGKTHKLRDLYATRHQRMREFFAAATGQDEEPPASPSPARPAAATTSPTPAALAPLRLLRGGADNGGGQSAADWPDPLQAARQPAAVASAAEWPEPLPGRAVTATAAPAGALTAPRPVEAAMRPVPEPLQRALEAFEAARDDRMHSEVLAAELGLSDKWALAKLMRGFGIRSRPKFKRDRLDRRGYFLDDIRAAADRIARGQAPAPITNDDEGEDDE